MVEHLSLRGGPGSIPGSKGHYNIMFFSILKSLKIFIMSEKIFRASTSNVKDLKKQRNRILALVNRAIREKNDADLISLTKMYALLYSAYAEMSFLKLIHTPKAFSESEIFTNSK